MRVLLRLTCLICALFALCPPPCATALSAPADSTQAYFFGARAAWHSLSHSVQFSGIGDIEGCCRELGTQDGDGILLAGFLEYWPASSLQLRLSVGIQDLGSLFTQRFRESLQVVGSSGPVVTDVTLEQRFDVAMSSILLQPGIGYRIFDRLFVNAGLRAWLLRSVEYSYTELLVEPDSVSFGRDIRERNTSDGALNGASSLVLGGVLGLSYDIPLSEKLYAVPTVDYAFSLSDLNDAGWQLTSLQLGLGLKYDLRTEEPEYKYYDTSFVRDTSLLAVAGLEEERILLADVETRIDTSYQALAEFYSYRYTEHYVREIPRRERQARLAVAITKLATHNEEEEAIGREERSLEQIELKDNLPLLPFVFFHEGDDKLHKARLHLMKPEETEGYRIDRLDAENPLALYPELLNIVALRLLENPDAAITLTGCTSDMGIEAGNLTLARSRAKAVQRYLMEVWGIDESRIRLKARNLPAKASSNQHEDGQAENRRVEISSSEPALLEPVILKKFAYESSFSAIAIETSTEAEDGVYAWQMELFKGARPLTTFKGRSELKSTINWEADLARLAADDGPLHVKFSVTDKSGQRANSERRLEIPLVTVQQRRSLQKEEKRVERYFLVIFDVNSAALTASHRRTIKSVADDLRSRDGATLTIHGYTDRTGSADYNNQLAERRCRSVRKALNLSDKRVAILPVGSKVLKYDNSFPEGRFYSRTVELLVEDVIQN